MAARDSPLAPALPGGITLGPPLRSEAAQEPQSELQPERLPMTCQRLWTQRHLRLAYGKKGGFFFKFSLPYCSILDHTTEMLPHQSATARERQVLGATKAAAH